jgi:redox-regulated HSP33 family molecular chaperone
VAILGLSEKEEREFYKDKDKRNGLAIICKACRSKYKYSKEYYQKIEKGF